MAATQGPRLVSFALMGDILDAVCRVSADELHDIVRAASNDDYQYSCEACGWPARFVAYSEQWLVVRPFLVLEEP